MTRDRDIFVGADETQQHLALKFSNRHGLIAGATGTGKTVTLQILAEGFSEAGVPVFLADVKGDLSGLSQVGTAKPALLARAEQIGLRNYEPHAAPVIFWDLFGKDGHPIRTTVSEMGPLLLARLLDLNETQEGVLNIAFQVADDEGLMVLDLKDLRSLLQFVSDNNKGLMATYGNVSPTSVGTIQRRLLSLAQQGGNQFFGEPALNLHDFMRTTPEGRGYINVLAADKLMLTPQLYATFLLWLLAELFEELPEVGDPEKPKLVFFFDEAHLLFDNAPRALVQKVEQVVRLIRSKGVGVYFVTQNPLDVPDEVLGQLGNRFQHALRAFTPRDLKAVKAAAETFRANPTLDVTTAIMELGVGEALVSTLQSKGVPSVVERTLIRPPSSRMGPANREERLAVIGDSPISDLYDESVDRTSAYEVLAERAASATEELREREEQAKREKERDSAARARSRRYESVRRGGRRQSTAEAMAKSALRSAGRTIGRELVRGLLGSLFKGR